MTAPKSSEALNYMRWAIIGSHGLYTGQWQTRKDAIFEHCRCYSIAWPQRPTDAETQGIWKDRRRVGDRAVKVRIAVLP